MKPMNSSPEERSSTLAERWLHGYSPGDGYGILWHLALRQDRYAMTELSRRLNDEGPSGDPFSSFGLAYRAFRLGDAIAAQNLALGCFNRRDLQGYRRWLRRAARLGDADAKSELRRFETRLPHGAAHDIGRGRPYKRYD